MRFLAEKFSPYKSEGGCVAPRMVADPPSTTSIFSFLSNITMARSKKPARRAPRRKVAPRRRIPIARRANVPDQASLSVKTSLQPNVGNNFVCNQMYNQINIQLAQYDRAVNVAKAYQFYRISKVKLTVLFPYDTFVSAAGFTGRPNFYYMLDKSGSLPVAATLDQLKQMGARPKVVDNKPTSIQWKPSVLTEEETLGGAVAAQYKLSPWLSVNAPTIQHRGVYWFLEQLFAGAGNGTQYEVEMEIQFEFKKPLWTGSPGTVAAIGSVPASSDEVLADAVLTAGPSFLH